eukprot:CAMPEP_0180299998 /NCGR_PEP_ID=MMETSP0988-20121125/22548_1 /TAXON_ID=697907 /ORGANISM="non described non described, Strain CCMP2293" /LENGTH=110 /DNA_ID=CAMNT_0022280115 /DNA_START=352 /DNA_END=684 /DNA_ORIENTATION=-
MFLKHRSPFLSVLTRRARRSGSVLTLTSLAAFALGFFCAAAATSAGLGAGAASIAVGASAEGREVAIGEGWSLGEVRLFITLRIILFGVSSHAITAAILSEGSWKGQDAG